MRALRWIVVAAGIGSVFSVPTPAVANGGAYIAFDRTHYLPGETAVGETYVHVPRWKQGLLERGPFHAFVLPGRTVIREDRPIPKNAIQVGTFDIEQMGPADFELTVSFMVPEVAGHYYSVMLCNEPCTVSGFREQLSGTISVVATARERDLLIREEHLLVRINGLRREARRAERASEATQARFEASEDQMASLASEVDRLESTLAGMEAAAPSVRTEEPAPRPLIYSWAAGGVVTALLLMAGTVILRRRRPVPVVVPDTTQAL